MLGKRNTQMKIIDAIKRNSNIILYLSLFSRQSSLGKWTLTLCVFGVHFSNGHFVALLLIPLKSVPLLLLLQCNTFAVFNSLTNTTSQGWRFRFLKVCRNVILLHISEDLDQTYLSACVNYGSQILWHLKQGSNICLFSRTIPRGEKTL